MFFRAQSYEVFFFLKKFFLKIFYNPLIIRILFKNIH